MSKTYDANTTVERIRARRRVKALSRAIRRGSQAEAKASSWAEHRTLSDKEMHQLATARKKLSGLTKLRGMLASFLVDTEKARAASEEANG